MARPRYPADLHAAHAGEKLPIAKIPDGVTFRPGDESVYGGRGSFYSLRYGPYLIGMNCMADKNCSLATPADVDRATDLVSGQSFTLGGAKIRSEAAINGRILSGTMT